MGTTRKMAQKHRADVEEVPEAEAGVLAEVRRLGVVLKAVTGVGVVVL